MVVIFTAKDAKIAKKNLAQISQIGADFKARLAAHERETRE